MRMYLLQEADTDSYGESRKGPSIKKKKKGSRGMVLPWGFSPKERRFSLVQLFMTPHTVACQAPLSMGFSRQEYWCGLPFSSPGELPNSGIKPGSPALQADCLPSEPPGKPNNTRVGSLSPFQGIFLTQELNQGLFHCRQILYRWTFFFFNLTVACRILVPQPRMELVFPAVESQTLDH